MKSNRHLMVFLFAIVALAATTACNDTKTLSPANGQLTVRVVMQPAAGVRPDPLPPFTWGEAVVSAVVFRPVDEQSDRVYGREGINCLESTRDADIVVTTGSDLRTVTLPAGVYALDRLAVNNFVVNVDPEDPLVELGEGRCGGVTGRDVTSMSLSVSTVSGGTRSFSPDTAAMVTVPEGGTGVFTILLDGEALTGFLSDHGSCATGSFVAVGSILPDDIKPFFSFE